MKLALIIKILPAYLNIKVKITEKQLKNNRKIETQKICIEHFHQAKVSSFCEVYTDYHKYILFVAGGIYIIIINIHNWYYFEREGKINIV